MRFAAGQAEAVLCSMIRLFVRLGGQLVRLDGDTVKGIGLVVERPAAHRQIEDSFAKPSVAVELGLAVSERSRCSAAWLAAVAALGLGRSAMAGMKLGLVDKFVRAA